MVKRNRHFDKLSASYLFPEIKRRVSSFLEQQPNASLIYLGIGDTTEPLSEKIVKGLHQKVEALGSTDGYEGYGPEQGIKSLREKIADVAYCNTIQSDEIFINDGAKCDIGRLQMLFGSSTSIAVQNPTYPVYVDSSILMGQYDPIHYLPCHPENNFFPDLEQLPKIDLIYFCSPNNPTGAVATRQQLNTLVEYAQRNNIIIIYDAAYSSYIQDPLLPRSIYEIEGATRVAIEVNSFSKMAGFTGLRLGWTVVPNDLVYEDGQKIQNDWLRLVTTIFNGASIISQYGGLAALSPHGLKETDQQRKNYLSNAKILKSTLLQLNYQVYGADHTPFLWVYLDNKNSWELFDTVLEKFNIVTTPGSGFGSAGHGFLRLSAFNKKETIEEAIRRFTNEKSICFNSCS